MKKIYLKRGKDESLRRFHPWIFSGAISSTDKDIEEGETVTVFTSENEYIATGHYQIGSIMVRVLTFDNETIDKAFYQKRLATAYKVRESIGVTSGDNNTYRLVHGEGDNLPGLVIDIYGNTAVMQAHSVGMHTDRFTIAEALKDMMADKGLKNIYYKSETTLPYKAELEQVNGFLYGGDTNDVAVENGLKFHVDWLKGQKTGFFVDQRENRSLLQHYAQGRKVLNMFCYRGGFSF